MKEKDILNVIKTLSKQQGFYTRLYNNIMELKENNAEQYNAIMEELEKQHFNDAIDFIMYIEG